MGELIISAQDLFVGINIRISTPTKALTCSYCVFKKLVHRYNITGLNFRGVGRFFKVVTRSSLVEPPFLPSHLIQDINCSPC